MKLRYLSADAGNRSDGVMNHRLWDHIPNFVSSGEDVTIVAISWFEDFKFNPELLNLNGKKWILADTLEHYSQWPDGKSHLFGISETPAFSGNTEWQKFSSWVKQNPPILQFVRELFQEDVSKFIQPLEWPCYLPAWEIEPKINFDSRPLEVFFQYGISDCSRPMLHGDMLKQSCRDGYEVINSLDHIDVKLGQAGRKWCAIHQPHTHRVHVNEVVRRQAQSKLTVSLKGAGWKCFRSSEVVHSVPAMHSPNLAWSFPWVHGENCIILTNGREQIELLEALTRTDLHQIYVNAQLNMDNYRMPNYWDRHIKPAIERVL